MLLLRMMFKAPLISAWYLFPAWLWYTPRWTRCPEKQDFQTWEYHKLALHPGPRKKLLMYSFLTVPHNVFHSIYTDIWAFCRVSQMEYLQIPDSSAGQDSWNNGTWCCSQQSTFRLLSEYSIGSLFGSFAHMITDLVVSLFLRATRCLVVFLPKSCLSLILCKQAYRLLNHWLRISDVCHEWLSMGSQLLLLYKSGSCHFIT